MRKIIIAGNWKMNLLQAEVIQLIGGIVKSLKNKTIPAHLKIVCSPVYPYLHVANSLIPSTLKNTLQLAAQDCSEQNPGAFTGEVNPAMLKDVGCKYVIIGHSERREYQKEDNQLLAAKTKNAIQAGLQVIFCCGERLEDRKNNQQFNIVQQQLEEGIFNLHQDLFSKVIIAYEPVWAIGTGETATPEQANEMHQFIRELIHQNFSEEIATKTSILYGGSMKPGNAKALLSQSDIDGGLIGGASLQAENFAGIIDANANASKTA